MRNIIIAEVALKTTQAAIHRKLDSIREYTSNYVAQTEAAGTVKWEHVVDLRTVDQMLENIDQMLEGWVIQTIEEMDK